MKKTALLTLCILLLLSGCGKNDQKELAIDEASSNSVVTLEEVASKTESDAIETELDAIALFKTTDEFDEYILARAYEKFIADGVDVEANSVFLSCDFDEYFDFIDSLSDTALANPTETIFCYTNDGKIKFVKGEFTCIKQDNQICLYECNLVNISDYLDKVYNNEIDDYNGYYEFGSFFYLDFLTSSFERLIKYQSSMQAEMLRTIMDEAGLAEDMPFISTLFKTDDWNDYASPEATVDKMLQELAPYEKTSLTSVVKHGTVAVSLPYEKQLAINTYVMGSAPDGTSLLGISGGGYANNLTEYKEQLYNTTLDDLEMAKEISIIDVWNDATDSEYFLVDSIEGEDVELYALTNFEGYIIKDGDKLYPVFVFVDDRTPKYFVKADFDEDGTYEYGFDLCRGRGTGYYVQGLVIVDPDEDDMVKLFDLDNLMLYNGNVFSYIKSVVDNDDCSVSYWLENDGKKTFEGKASLAEYAKDTLRPVRFGFGDQLSIEYSDGKWRFIAEGGIIWSEADSNQEEVVWKERPQPDYEWYIDLTGDIQYKNGYFTYEKIKLSDLKFYIY